MIQLRAAVLSLFLAVFSAAVLLAQGTTESYKVDVDLNQNAAGGGFFASPWVWVVGGAVFILLLVALLRSGGNKGDD